MRRNRFNFFQLSHSGTFVEKQRYFNPNKCDADSLKQTEEVAITPNKRIHVDSMTIVLYYIPGASA